MSVKSNVIEKKTLVRDNIVEIIPVEGSLFIFGGIAHSVENRGTIYYVKNVAEALDLDIFSLLPEKPVVVLYDESNALFSILGFTGFVEIYLGQDRNKLGSFMKVYHFENTWERLYPNSAIREGQHLLIGLQHVVAVLKIRYRKADITYYSNANGVNETNN